MNESERDESVNRREFISATATVALCLSYPARAQPAGQRTVAFVSNAAAEGSMHLVAAFRQGLKESGLVEGRDVTIEYRWAEQRNDRLQAFMVELIQRHVDVIAVGGGTNARTTAKRATTTMPVVFATGSDPVQEGLVASLNRPGGNITGVTFVNTMMEPKRLGLLNEVMPAKVPFAAFVDPALGASALQVAELQQAARTAGRSLRIARPATPGAIEDAFRSLEPPVALLVAASPLFLRRRRQIVELASEHAIPAIYESREFAESGGMMSYGASVAEGYRQMGAYVGKILKGAKPSELPVLQVDKYELVINLGTAARLGVTIPQSVLLRADATI